MAFLDILGFKLFVRDTIKKPDIIERFDFILHKVKFLLNFNLKIMPVADIRMFSDSICISCPFSSANLVQFIYVMDFLQFTMINAGVFIRGGISIGQHYFSERMVASEALIAAYELESTMALYPRIVSQKRL